MNHPYAVYSPQIVSLNLALRTKKHEKCYWAKEIEQPDKIYDFCIL